MNRDVLFRLTMTGMVFLVGVLLFNAQPLRAAEAAQPATLGSLQALEKSAAAVPGQRAGVYAAIYGGGNHTCGLTTGGGVKCWGENTYGQLGDGTLVNRRSPVDVIGLSSGVIALSAGLGHNCVILEGGGVKCWGSNSFGELGDGTTTDHSSPVQVQGLESGVTTVAGANRFTCALTGGGVKCWGKNTWGELGNGTTTNSSVPGDVSGLSSNVTKLFSGWSHSCAETTGGTVKCWGDNYYGQLGNGATAPFVTIPVNVSGIASGVNTMAIGWEYTCAVLPGGGVKCWGQNRDGQLGDGTYTNKSIPTQVSGLESGYEQLGGGWGTVCARSTSGGVKCWGANDYGYLGTGNYARSNVPLDVSGLASGAAWLTTGASHSCVIMDTGEVRCWGLALQGQLGDGTMNYRTIPGDVSLLDGNHISISNGWGNSCTVSGEGAVMCWGNNGAGILGNGTYDGRNIPETVSGLESLGAAVTTGRYSACVLTTGGGVKCWGDNDFGGLGDGTTITRLTPVDVIGLGSGVAQVGIRGSHTCALMDTGGVKCWGQNDNGQLGNNSTTESHTPVNVSGLGSGVKEIAVGMWHTCALMDGGGVKCWGSNYSGILGDNSTTNRKVPVDVYGLSSGVIKIAAGFSHTCAVLDGGGAKCWGSNEQGKLGDGTTTNSNIPVDVIGVESGVTDIAIGEAHTCAILTGGGVKCWGDNLYGQLGNGLYIDSNIPVSVLGLSAGATAIALGFDHTCALVGNGRVKCWGSDGEGQLGIGTFYHRLTPGKMPDTLPLILDLNYSGGAKGSLFTITGWNFIENAPVSLSVNGHVLTTTLPTTMDGSFIAFLDTSVGDPGGYLLLASNGREAFAQFSLYDGGVPKPIEGGGVTFSLPAGIAVEFKYVYLPLVRR